MSHQQSFSHFDQLVIWAEGSEWQYVSSAKIINFVNTVSVSNSLDPDQARHFLSGLIWIQTVCNVYLTVCNGYLIWVQTVCKAASGSRLSINGADHDEMLQYMNIQLSPLIICGSTSHLGAMISATLLMLWIQWCC